MDEDATHSPYVSCDTSDYRVDFPKVQQLARTICAQLGVSDYELSISFVDSKTIQELNSEHRGKDSPTDVLSFPQCEFDEPLLSSKKTELAKPSPDQPPKTLGDIIISLNEASQNALKIGQDLDKEVCFLLVHGVLHLCGHDHMEKGEENIMLGEQRKIMNLISDQTEIPLWNDAISSVQEGTL